MQLVQLNSSQDQKPAIKMSSSSSVVNHGGPQAGSPAREAPGSECDDVDISRGSKVGSGLLKASGSLTSSSTSTKPSAPPTTLISCPASRRAQRRQSRSSRTLISDSNTKNAIPPTSGSSLKATNGTKKFCKASEEPEVEEEEEEEEEESCSTSVDEPSAAAAALGTTSLKGSSQTGSGSVASLENICAGCGKPIRERYLLEAMNKRWHEDCLKCACCDCRLGEVGSSLYEHSNKLLCKRDFLRIFGPYGTCAACKTSIPPYDLVMRVQKHVYHLDCFACRHCQARFCVGDRFHLTEELSIECAICYSERVSGHQSQLQTQERQQPQPQQQQQQQQQRQALLRLDSRVPDGCEATSGP